MIRWNPFWALQTPTRLPSPVPTCIPDWRMSPTMIQSRSSTNLSGLYDFSKHIGSSPCDIWPSPPASTFTTSTPSSECTSDNPEQAVRSFSMISALARRKFLSYPRLNMPEALELRFTEKSLKGGAGVNIGHDDTKRVLLPHLHCRTMSHCHRGGTFSRRC